MLNAIVTTIPHDLQRYDTAGDYFPHGSGTAFRISDLGNKDFEFLILIHELVEWFLTQKRGIAEADITAFDIASEADEPGNDPAAPYHKEHQFASQIERMVADEAGIDWEAYEAALEALDWQPPSSPPSDISVIGL